MAYGAYDVFVESFTMYDPTNPGSIATSLATRWNDPRIAAGGAVLDMTGGRNSNPALTLAVGSFISKTMAHNNHWIAGAAFKNGVISNATGGLITLLNNDQRLFQLNQNSDGTLSLTGANDSQIIGTTPGPIVFDGAWYYWEVDVSFSGSSNVVTTAELRVNGVVVIASGSVATTLNNANFLSRSSTANVFQLRPGSAGVGNMAIDGSFYIHNTTSADVPGYWGDIRILKVLPDGDTATIQWTPSTGMTHWDLVNELPQTGDASYVEDGVVGEKDIYTWQDLSPLVGVIRTVQLSACVRKTDEGSKSFKTGVGATLSTLSDEFFPNDSYIYYHYNWDVDPATALPWTIPNFNATVFGQQVIS